jgi:hypothetical protein
MTHAATNDLFWTAGLLPQATLLALLFRRGLARTLLAFTTLLAFYILRSAALFALSGHVDPTAYAVTYDLLSLADLLLQLLVAAQIASTLVRAAGGWATLPGRTLLLVPMLAVAATLLLIRLVPGNSPFPPDRMQLFNWLALALLGLWTLSLPSSTRHEPAQQVSAQQESRLFCRIALGLALYAAMGVCATTARAFAALHHDALRVVQWSYVLPFTWIFVVLCWIALLKPSSSAPHADNAPHYTPNPADAA